jgi:hypothetical protein
VEGPNKAPQAGGWDEASATFTLRWPVQFTGADGREGELLESVKLSRLNGRQMREIVNARAKGEGEMLAVMVSKSAGIPPSTVDRLDAADLAEIGAVVAGFIGGGLPTGQT